MGAELRASPRGPGTSRVPHSPRVSPSNVGAHWALTPAAGGGTALLDGGQGQDGSGLPAPSSHQPRTEFMQTLMYWLEPEQLTSVQRQPGLGERTRLAALPFSPLGSAEHLYPLNPESGAGASVKRRGVPAATKLPVT